MRLIIAEKVVFLEIEKNRYRVLKTNLIPTNIKHIHQLGIASQSYKCCHNTDYLSQQRCKICERFMCKNCIRNNKCPHCGLDLY